MTLFTPVQLRVLKTSWFPALIIWLVTSGYTLTKIQHWGNVEFVEKGLSPLVQLLPLFLMVIWETLIKKEWTNVVLLGLTVIVTYTLQLLLNASLTEMSYGTMYLLSHTNAFLIMLVLMITRFYLSGMGDKLTAALTAAVIFFLIPKDGLPLSIPLITRDFPAYGLSPYYRMAIDLPVGYCAIICYYGIIFLTENSYKWQFFLLRLQSKVQVVNRWEYFFVFLMIWFVYIGSIGALDTRISAFFEGVPTPVVVTGFDLFTTLSLIFFIYLGAGLLRNIVMSRALTTGQHSSWILIMHYLPILNIVALVQLFFAKESQPSQRENAASYLQVNRLKAQYFMIAAGITVTVVNIYFMMTVPTGLRLPAIGLLAGLYLLKIFAYLRLRTSKTFIFLVIGLNALTLLFGYNEYLLLSLCFLYLYYYLLMELFYPKLEIEDTMKLPEPEAGDIFTHTA
jgi:hypothetical protein